MINNIKQGFSLGVTILALLTISLTGALAQTGSHVGATTSPLTSFWYSAPDDLKKIRKLLGEGRSKEAVKASYDFLEMLKQSRSDDNVKTYFGLNALCVSHTSNKSTGDAIAACDKAVRIFPDKWQAYNNRGTAHYIRGDFRKAAEDYGLAIEFSQGSDNARNILRHNVELAEAQIPNK